MPSKERAAISVVFLPRLRGTLALARSPLGARAYKGVNAMLEPHSSINTKASVGSLPVFSRHVARSSSLRSLAANDFFSRPTELFDRSTHGPAAHPFTVGLLPQVAVLFQGGIDMCL